MRPFQIISLAVFAVLAAAGLYLFASYKGFGGGTDVGAVTIWGTVPSQSVQGAIDDIKRVNRGFDNVTYVERPATSFGRDVADALASGTGPDIILISQEELISERSKLQVIPFKTIPERTFRDSYASISELFLTPEGTYGIPLLVDPLVLYYNRALISQAGYASAPQTWEQVLGATPGLTARTGTNVLKSAIALGTYDNIENARAIISLLFLQSGSEITKYNGARVESTLSATPAIGDAVTPVQSALNFYTQFADPAKIVYTWNRSLGNARARFVSGDSALYIGYASEYQFIRLANPNLDFDITTIPFPQTTSGRVDYARVYALAIPKSGKNVSGAYTVASTIASAESASAIAVSMGVAPALRSLLAVRSSDPNAAIYYPLALISKGWLSPAPATTDQIFAGMINSVISGGQTAQQAIKDAGDSLSAAMR